MKFALTDYMQTLSQRFSKASQRALPLLFDTENPAESQELIPAKERETIGWEMVNRLATEHKDFMEYITLVKHFYQTGVLKPADWKLA